MTVAPDLAGFCNCLAVRQAARHVSQLYDRLLAPLGLKTTQFSILRKLKKLGPLTVQALAAEMVMDRTTLARAIKPLQRDGLIVGGSPRRDRRIKYLSLTSEGEARLLDAYGAWQQGQRLFEDAFGSDRTKEFRAILRDVVATDFVISKES